MFQGLQHSLAAQPTLAPVLMIVIVVLLGVAAQIVSDRSGLPSIIFLLLGGVALGPDGLGLVRPEVFGDGLLPIVALCVAVIVFEGAMRIDLHHLKRMSRPVLGLITIGLLFTTAAASLLAWKLLGIPYRVALLFGALVSVTGPTVITPILARLALRPRLKAVLEGESVFADAIGVMLASTIFSYITALHSNPVWKLAPGMGHLLINSVLGGVVGAGLSMVGWLILKRLSPLPGPLVRLGVLATALLTYVVSEVFAHETGIFAVAVAGVVFGSLPLPYAETLRQLERDLTLLALSVVFILLAANLPLAGLIALGWPAVGLVALLMVLVRPACVFISTLGSDLSWRDKSFMALLAPRGIVAASAATFFSLELQALKIPGGGALAELVFLVVLVTVIIEGAGAPWIARKLRIIPPKVFLLGGDKQARRLAESLVAEGESVHLLDDNLDNVHALLSRELTANLCKLEDCDELRKHGAHRAKKLVIATDSDERNLSLARTVQERFPRVPVYVRLNEENNRPKYTELCLEIWPQTEDRPSPLPLSVWNAAVQPDAAVEVEVQNPLMTGKPLSELELPSGCLLIVMKRGSRTVVPRGNTVLQQGDRVTIVGDTVAVEKARRLMLGTRPTARGHRAPFWSHAPRT